MIAQAIADEVERLVADGRLSQREIARVTGISRGTVSSIALGRRTKRQSLDPAFDPTRPLTPPRRCGGCGGKVYHPCLLCRVRELKARKRQKNAAQSQARPSPGFSHDRRDSSPLRGPSISGGSSSSALPRSGCVALGE